METCCNGINVEKGAANADQSDPKSMNDNKDYGESVEQEEKDINTPSPENQRGKEETNENDQTNDDKQQSSQKCMSPDNFSTDELGGRNVIVRYFLELF